MGNPGLRVIVSPAFLVDIVTVDDDPAWPHAGVFGSQRVRSLWEPEGLQDFPEGLFGCASVTFFFFLRGTHGTFCSFLRHL